MASIRFLIYLNICLGRQGEAFICRCWYSQMTIHTYMFGLFVSSLTPSSD